ncbi:FAD1 flavin adenine dinucleotide synthetase [Entophlyctis sp. JEL0112]|nr:FAD1 flavin adenine dinucleotide synthetase [Entophlyctis sp. JEL0112]
MSSATNAGARTGASVSNCDANPHAPAAGNECAHHEADALRVLAEAAATFGIQGLAISFNGGKDCTVMLHLLLRALAQLQHDQLQLHQQDRKTQRPGPEVNLSNLEKKHEQTPDHQQLQQSLRVSVPIPCLYVTAADPFPEVDDFVQRAADLYNLKVYKTSQPMKIALKSFLGEFPEVKAVLVGTRRTDPYSQHLKPFDPTDGDWPPCMRVHPILDWSYQQIWAYLRSHCVDYCCLYDSGYTSLGSVHNTVRNPALKNASGGYDAAYMLADGSLERNGRV